MGNFSLLPASPGIPSVSFGPEFPLGERDSGPRDARDPRSCERRRLAVAQPRPPAALSPAPPTAPARTPWPASAPPWPKPPAGTDGRRQWSTPTTTLPAPGRRVRPRPGQVRSRDQRGPARRAAAGQGGDQRQHRAPDEAADFLRRAWRRRRVARAARTADQPGRARPAGAGSRRGQAGFAGRRRSQDGQPAGHRGRCAIDHSGHGFQRKRRMATSAPAAPQASSTPRFLQSSPACWAKGPSSAWLNGRTGRAPGMRSSTAE